MMPTSARPLLRVMLLLLLCVPLTARSETALQSLRHFYGDIRSFQAQFTQIQLDAQQHKLEQSQGQFWLRRPDKFRWEYEQPYQQVIVSDGRKIQHYDSELSQVTVRPVTQALASTPALLLTGQTALEDRFTLRELPEQAGQSWVELAPRAQDTDFKRIRLGFNHGELAVMELLDNFDQTTRIQFQQVKINTPIDEARFQLQLPPGVDVVGG
jgi:outer membrane lipoprotein carrier protein